MIKGGYKNLGVVEQFANFDCVFSVQEDLV